MLDADVFIRACLERGLRLWSGVPCSYLTPLIDRVIAGGDGLRYVGAANEGDAVAVVAGAWLGGSGGVVMMQNSGLGNAVSPLTSLAHTFRIPVLLVVTHRGQPGGPADEPQHALMGAITTDMLALMAIPWEPFPSDAAAIEGALARATAHMQAESTPYALVMAKGTVAPGPPAILERQAEARAGTAAGAASPPASTREQVLRAVLAAAGPDDVLIATTGYTGRQLHALGDRPNQLYMAGSMGCAAPLALGLALTRPDRRIVVLDGDGALLMRMGTMATIGHEHPPNLLHVVLDNGMHESTGGQATVSGTVDFAEIAVACGYAHARRLPDAAAVGAALGEASGPALLHVRIRPAVPEQLPRPAVSPPEVARRLRSLLGG